MISVGSTNIVKVQAVEEAVKEYPALAALRIQTCSVPSGVADQPLSLEEIIQGAKNRAASAFAACPGCHYGFGIESGLFEVNGDKLTLKNRRLTPITEP